MAAHAGTAEGIRRAVMAGVASIEHGDGGTPETWALMKERNVALCPTLAASDAVARYGGWKGDEPFPPRLASKRASFRDALAAGVTICSGSDVGVFSHGENVREIDLMVEYGMPPLDALRSATSVDAMLLGLQDRIGEVRPGLDADLLVVGGNPATASTALRDVRLVMKAGLVVRGPSAPATLR